MRNKCKYNFKKKRKIIVDKEGWHLIIDHEEAFVLPRPNGNDAQYISPTYVMLKMCDWLEKESE